MTTILSRCLCIDNKELLTGVEAYEQITNRLEKEISECEDMLCSLRQPQVKAEFIKNWTPNQSSFTVEEWSG